MTMQPFTDNFADNSTEAGFQFTFFCEACQEGYKSKFIPSKSYGKGKFLKGVSGILSAAAQLAGKYNIGYGLEKGADVIGERFVGMSPEWQKEHDEAFEFFQNEAKSHFYRCPNCKKWYCENDWNEQEGLCVECAPREAVKVAAAKATKKIADIEEKAQATKIFTGEIESKQTICPQCGKPAGNGKFCNNCGQALTLIKCSKCGAKNIKGTLFCGECGEKYN
jgi:hypothetical protein